jgi:hypothetical protein
LRLIFSKEEKMFPDINEINRIRKKYNWQMSQSGITAFREMGELEANALKNGALRQKYKELIALGISINNSCYG